LLPVVETWRDARDGNVGIGNKLWAGPLLGGLEITGFDVPVEWEVVGELQCGPVCVPLVGQAILYYEQSMQWLDLPISDLGAGAVMLTAVKLKS